MLMSKIDVNGPNTHPLYEKLKSNGSRTFLSTLGGTDIKWNFGKFLVTGGDNVKRYEPTTSPTASRATSRPPSTPQSPLPKV